MNENVKSRKVKPMMTEQQPSITDITANELRLSDLNPRLRSYITLQISWGRCKDACVGISHSRVHINNNSLVHYPVEAAALIDPPTQAVVLLPLHTHKQTHKHTLSSQEKLE